MTANPSVRPYVLSRGRTRTNHQQYVHTLVSVDPFNQVVADRLAPEARRLYERAAMSLAELSSHCGVGGVLTHTLNRRGRHSASSSRWVPPLTVDVRSRRSTLQALMASQKSTLEKTSPLLAR